MSNDNVYERLWRLQASVNKLVLDGKRDAEEVANIYQGIISGSVTTSFEKIEITHEPPKLCALRTTDEQVA